MAIARWNWIFLTSLSISACLSVYSQENTENKTTETAPSRDIAPNISGNSNRELLEPNPILIFPGGSAGFPTSFTDMAPARTQLVRLGFPEQRIHIVTYDDSQNKSDIVREAGIKLTQIINSYPAGTKFDLVGHSLGHPVSLIVMAENGFLGQTGRIIGIAGIMFGQNANKPFLCRLRPSLCGDLYDAFSRTNKPVVITQLLATFRTEMAAIKKCSFYSPQDGMLDPVDSGKFPDGINISIPDVRHLDFKSNTKVFDAIKEHCYKE